MKISEQEMDALVLDYLNKRENELGKERFYLLSLWGVKALDIRKCIERPHDCKKWPEYFFDMAEIAIEKTYKHLILNEPLTFNTRK